MKRRYVILLVTLAAMLGGLAAQPAANAASALINVVVTNDTAHPVPTRATGTTTVGGTVEVGNSSDEPVPVSGSVSVADEREPFEVRLDFSLDDGGFSYNTSDNFTVPAGKRLIVQFVSARFYVPQNQTPTLSANADSGATGYPVALQQQGLSNGLMIWSGSLSVLDFAPAGTYFFDLSRAPTNQNASVPGSASGFVYLSGYLVPA